MVLTAEQKVEARYRQQLAEGVKPRPLTQANWAILDRLMAERKESKKRRREECQAAKAAAETGTAAAEALEFVPDPSAGQSAVLPGELASVICCGSSF